MSPNVEFYLPNSPKLNIQFAIAKGKEKQQLLELEKMEPSSDSLEKATVIIVAD